MTDQLRRIGLKVVRLTVDEETKAQMDLYKDVNWSEVLRRVVQSRVEVEARLRAKIDRARALRAAKDMERLRAKTSGKWSGTEEIRRWREQGGSYRCSNRGKVVQH